MPKNSSPSKPIASPCVSICELDENNICQGCFRDDREIREWSTYSDEQKRSVLKQSLQRFSASGKNVFN
jgi:predicted Fe-S protein YdhL (DUF1289 family)